MSSAINVYALRLDQLTQLLGSRNASAIRTINEAHSYFLSNVDAIDDQAGMTCAQAVAELINGESSKDGPGYLYGYALEAVCAHVGRELPNICPIAGASSWIEEVDAFLESKGIPIRLSKLVQWGSPVPIPEPDDYPSIGYWSSDEIPPSIRAFAAADLSGAENDMVETLSQLRSWLQSAAKDPQAMVIGFLS